MPIGGALGDAIGAGAGFGAAALGLDFFFAAFFAAPFFAADFFFRAGAALFAFFVFFFDFDFFFAFFAMIVLRSLGLIYLSNWRHAPPA
jgi:hypothetical protein